MNESPQDRPQRESVIGRGGLWLAKWSLVLVAIAASTTIVVYVLAQLWVIVLPVLLAVVVSTVLWPATRALRERNVPPALAAAASLLVFFAVVVGAAVLIAPSVSEQAPELARNAADGVNQLETWLTGPPLNVEQAQIDDAVQAVLRALQESSTAIASGVVTGVSAAGSFLVTTVLVLVLSFFFVKDGPRFLPWVTSTIGDGAGRHLATVLAGVWTNVGSFIRTQAFVSFIDAVFIGAGLLIVGVPLAPLLIFLTFIGGFVPIVGAFVAGALAVLVALVSNGLTAAIIMLVIIVAVQQLEGNLLQPLLQSQSMNLHPVVVLLAVTAGGSLFGITGAFLAVPAVSSAAVVLRYVNELIRHRTAEPESDAPEPA